MPVGHTEEQKINHDQQMGAIQARLGEIETKIDRILDREETRVSRMNEIEREYAIHCEQCVGHRKGFEREFETMKTDINNIRNLPKEEREKQEAKQRRAQFILYMLYTGIVLFFAVGGPAILKAIANKFMNG